MILIDASNIHNGGGKVLFEYLLDELLIRKIDFFVIKDSRWVGYDLPKQYSVTSTSAFERRRLLLHYTKVLSPISIRCFGNFPPCVRLPCKTLTYFQNPNLLDSVIEQTPKDTFFILKKWYMQMFLKNTDTVIFQNQTIHALFKDKYGKYAQPNIEYINLPFFDKARIIAVRNAHLHNAPKENRFAYISLPHKHKNHKNLLKSWEILAEQSIYPELVLTIPSEEKALFEQIERLKKKGLKIINLGIIPFQASLNETAKSEYCIFPSFKETFGLGLIEAALTSQKVLAADLPYTYEVLKPSLVFNPFDPIM